jgi:hypothetical protein
VSRFPLCPCTHVPLDGWCVTHGLWPAAALLLALLAGCSTLPPTAYPVPPDDIAAVHDAWVRAGQPPCLPLPVLWVFEATPAERVEWCDRSPPPGACLARANVNAMRQVWLAVVSPEYPAGWRHEAFHMFEACITGAHDYAHAGPQWSDAGRDDAGIP